MTTRGAQTFILPASAHQPLKLALVAFAAAASISILTQLPLRYREATVNGLRAIVESSWDDSEADALETVTRNRLTVLGCAKLINTVKAWALVLALGAESAAVVCLAWAMVNVF